MSAAGAGPPVLTDGVVLLRPATLDDVDEITLACQDAESQRWTSALPSPYGRADAVRWVSELGPADWAAQTAVHWAVASADDPGRWAGTMSVRILDRDGDLGDVGYLTAPWARGRGWTTRALVLARDFALGPWRLARLEWRAFVGNEASRRVAQKAGFQMEDVQRGRLVRRGERADAWEGAVLAADLDTDLDTGLDTDLDGVAAS